VHENMLGTSSPAPAGRTARSRVTNGKSLWLDGDKRGPAARRFRDIFAAIIGDLGGGDLLTEGQKQLARRCSLLAVECEQIEALDDASIEAAIEHGRPLELPPREGTRYYSFVDMSGGRHDTCCISIVHKDGERLIADVVRGRQGDPAAAAREFCDLAKQYRCGTIAGDNYAASGSLARSAIAAVTINGLN
jgi:hypothetical protein